MRRKEEDLKTSGIPTILSSVVSKIQAAVPNAMNAKIGDEFYKHINEKDASERDITNELQTMLHLQYSVALAIARLTSTNTSRSYSF
jgi:hypothetical protein